MFGRIAPRATRPATPVGRRPHKEYWPGRHAAGIVSDSRSPRPGSASNPAIPCCSTPTAPPGTASESATAPQSAPGNKPCLPPVRPPRPEPETPSLSDPGRYPGRADRQLAQRLHLLAPSRTWTKPEVVDDHGRANRSASQRAVAVSEAAGTDRRNQRLRRRPGPGRDRLMRSAVTRASSSDGPARARRWPDGARPPSRTCCRRTSDRPGWVENGSRYGHVPAVFGSGEEARLRPDPAKPGRTTVGTSCHGPARESPRAAGRRSTFDMRRSRGRADLGRQPQFPW